MTQDRIVIGIDPGTAVTGYGIVLGRGNSFELITYGCIRPSPKMSLPYRYRTIFEELSLLLDRHKPSALAVESQFVEKNVGSAIKLGMARGVILLAASLREIPTFEYPPTTAKLSVTGSGRASKEQIERMVRCLLGMKEKNIPEDAADALSIAICHINQSHSCMPSFVVN